MKYLKNRLLLALLIFSSAAACAPDADTPQDAPEATTPGTTGPGGKGDHLGDTQEEGQGAEQGIPSQISTAGIQFTGVLPAQGSVELTLNVAQDDTVIMWLHDEGAESWMPGLAVYPLQSDDAVVYFRSRGGEDAHIPYKDEDVADGFRFRFDDSYRLELTNPSDVEGVFRFTLECLSGPCEALPPEEPTDLEDTPDAGGQDGATDASGQPSASPYAGLTNDALRSALKDTHGGHRNLGYSGARDHLFDYQIENVGAPGQIECVYTGRTAYVDDRGDAQSRHDYNTEHTWPQSRGAGGVAKSDMHHLFVTDARANSRRSSYKFDEVLDATWSEGGSKLGENAAGQIRYEPRDVHKGNVARAIFYFAVVYDYSISQDEEAALRQWHQADPVDAAERARNDAIEGFQNSRNFFIDWPELVEKIDDF